VVLDGLRWLRRHGATQALVNTQHNNAGALALYEACGFRELPAGLCVMGRSL
jgi:ribosomal protein S18 acetylase RimI-like enzyme